MDYAQAINIAPLHGIYDFPETEDRFELGQNVCIVRNPPIKIPDSFKDHVRNSDLETLRGCSWALRHAYSADPEVHLGPKERKSDEFLSLALLAMWVTQPSGAYFSHIIKYHPRGSMDEVSTILKSDNFHPHRSYSSIHFSVSDIPDLSSIFLSFLKAFKEEKRLFRAMSFLFTGLRIPFYEPRYVTFTTILECLFSTSSSEVTHKLSERIACFLVESPDERLKLFKLTKKLYNIRSNIVHGSDPSKKEIATSDTSAADLERIVHRTMKRIFLNTKLADQFSAKPDELEKYFEKLLFN